MTDVSFIKISSEVKTLRSIIINMLEGYVSRTDEQSIKVLL